MYKYDKDDIESISMLTHIHRAKSLQDDLQRHERVLQEVEAGIRCEQITEDTIQTIKDHIIKLKAILKQHGL